MAEINFNNEKRIEASFTKEKSIKTNVTNLNYIPAYVEYERERQENEEERQAYYEEIQNRINNGEFNGKDGVIGKSLEYDWNGTKLGIRQEGQTEYEYVDLKGEKGEAGDGTGGSGGSVSIETLTNQEIEDLINNNT